MRNVLILGAGFGGLELASCLASDLRDDVRVTLIDQADGFTFGFSKLEVAFRGVAREAVRLPYAAFAPPGVEFRQERVTAIDPATRQVATDGGDYEPDVLVVALGADYDQAATPGFVEDGEEFYSVDGARRLHERLRDFDGGRIVLAILSVPFKCPPAPYEGALLLEELLTARGVRARTEIHVVTPMDSPIPVSRSASQALVTALAERGIEYSPGRRVRALDPVGHLASTRLGDLPYDLFIGVPAHRVPAVVEASGLAEGGNDGWVAVDRETLQTRFPGVFAIGDCADAPVPRAGVFAEAEARTVAGCIAAQVHGSEPPEPFLGQGACYIEFGGGMVGKVDVDFLSGPAPRAPFEPASRELAAEKSAFAAVRRARWFGA
jgi:sulfide:quinone oxidoreductase